MDGELSEPVAHVDGCGQVLALDKTGSETGGKRVTGTVGVDNLGGVQSVDRELAGGELLCGSVVGDGQCGVGTLGEDYDSWLLGVGLWQRSNLLGDLLEVGGAELVGFCVSGSLGFVTDDVVGIWGALVQCSLEELWDEWSREVHDERLVLLGGVLA